MFVFCLLADAGFPMTVYDYLFPGDTAEDACDSVSNLFNIEVMPQNVNCGVELVPSKSFSAPGTENI